VVFQGLNPTAPRQFVQHQLLIDHADAPTPIDGGLLARLNVITNDLCRIFIDELANRRLDPLEFGASCQPNTSRPRRSTRWLDKRRHRACSVACAESYLWQLCWRRLAKCPSTRRAA